MEVAPQKEKKPLRKNGPQCFGHFFYTTVVAYGLKCILPYIL